MYEHNPEKLSGPEGAIYRWNPEHGRYYSGEFLVSPEAEALARQSHHYTNLLNIQYDEMLPLMHKKNAAESYKKEHGSFPADYNEQAINENLERIQKQINAINEAYYPSDFGVLDAIDVAGKLILFSGIASVAILGGTAVLAWKAAKLSYNLANSGWEKLKDHPSLLKAGLAATGATASFFATEKAVKHWDKVTAFAAKTADTVLQIGIAAGTNAALFIGAYKASELAINKITGKDHEKVNTAVAGAVTLGANIAAYKHMREEHIHTATGLLKDIWNHGAHFAHTIGEIGLWGAFTVATYAVGHEVSDHVQDRVAGKSSGLVNKISGVAAFAAAALGMYHITHADVPPAPARQPVEYSAPLQPVPAPTAP